MSTIRDQWVPHFEKAGFSREALMQMPSSEFSQIALAIIKSGVIPPLPNESLFPDKKTRIALQCALFNAKVEMIERIQRENELKREKRKHESVVKTEAVKQDEEFYKLLEEHEQAQQQEKQIQKQEEEQRQHVINKKKQILDDFAALGKEPANGFVIAVMMPSGKRIMRKFTADQKGKDIITWVAANEEMFKGEEPIDFELKNVINDIEADKTLEEQRIKGRVMLQLNVFDENDA